MSDWKHPIDNRKVVSKQFGGESTPFVFNDRLYRLENLMRSKDFPKEIPQYLFHEDGFRIRDADTDRVISVPLLNHYFATAFVRDNRVHVFCGDYGENQPWWHIKRYVRISSSDLVTWSAPETVAEANETEHLFNNSVCFDGNRYIMLIETDDPQWVKFTFKFYSSTDLINWTPIENAVYGPDKYVGGPALYHFDDMYYLLYLANKPPPVHVTRISRSADLINWVDAADDRPFLSFDPTYETDPENYPGSMEKNASDAELCEYRGKTIINFNGGNQVGCADLKESVFDGTPEQLLKSFF